MPITIRLATAADFDAVAALRLAAYRAAPEFTIADEAAVTRWDGQVLVADCSANGLVATMQYIPCRSLADLAHFNGSLPAVEFKAFPTLLLNRGATRPGRHYQGLNSRLRLAMLETALADPQLQSLTGFVYAGAPRLNLLRALGYSFCPVSGADITFGEHTEELFVALPRTQFAIAAEQLRQMLALA
ncbi:hypothetical protein [Hymenobacter cheonanensis]|uniref:hypothetical protein n=1 Tax=Hymenobacter sp. CA2-7 TaxID=3063993 RepID=UPI0027134200|nr:hypothetical protein [Hymenobacter sp. CA2-7]MDO7886636.1 hypothetical protein [Hymenobacter sp. CA2-7]